MSEFSRPTVLVTGGAKRLGGFISRAFGMAGWHVVIHFHTSAKAAEKMASSLPSAETFQCDLANETSATEMIESLAARLPDFRVLVNCASLFEFDSVTALDPEANRRAMAVNARTPACMAQAFLAKAKAPDGRRVIQVTDQKVANPNPDFFSYTMSKHALAATVPMLAMGAQQPKDRVYGLAPGAILASHDQDEAETEVSHRLNLLVRKTAPEEVAEAALFLASGTLASGQTLFVDSGQHLLSQPRDVIYLAREGATA
ncbi:SDR family oxidoreductase [Erythrobacter sp.]|uniref:SDR family oxidoreductase n=1 Tax=Erythrobacter sp. TaxID=1042 RepID=UPI00311EAE53